MAQSAKITFPATALTTSAPRPTVDIDGFAEAQEALRQKLGVDCVFLTPSAPQWPPDTQLDPETGKPFDPFLEPVNPTADSAVTVRCSFVHRPLRHIDPRQSPFGDGDEGDAALIVPLARYQDVRAATRVVIGEDTWEIQRFRYDVALTVPRWIAYLERA